MQKDSEYLPEDGRYLSDGMGPEWAEFGRAARQLIREGRREFLKVFKPVLDWLVGRLE